jgi:hypothetical protein
MLPFGVTIPATVPQRSDIPDGLTNYPVHYLHFYIVLFYDLTEQFKMIKYALFFFNSKNLLIFNESAGVYL